MTARAEPGRSRVRRASRGLALLVAAGLLAGCAAPAEAADPGAESTGAEAGSAEFEGAEFGSAEFGGGDGGSAASSRALAAAQSDRQAAERSARQTEEHRTVQITDIAVAGPAADREPGTPNRLGSRTVPVRVYTPAAAPWAELVWAHGGSFVRGTLDWPEADWVARSFAASGIRVHSVDYVLASETVHAPAPGNDVAAVLAEVTAGSELPVVVGGASAGAHLAVLAALAQADRAATGDGRAAAALILEYPTLHRVQRADPVISAATAALPEARRFDADRIAAMYASYLGSPDPAAAAPAVAGELPADRLRLLPPTVIVNADADDLRASGEQFAEQLASAGVRVVSHVQPGTVHGYLNRPEESAQARLDATATITGFVDELRVILAP